MIQFNANFNSINNTRHYRLLSYSRQTYCKDWKSYEHIHPYTEIFFITEGKGYFHAIDKNIPLKKGMVILNNPNVRHTEFSSESEPLAYAVFAFDNLAFAINKESQSLQPVQNDSMQPQTFCFDYSSHFEELKTILRHIESECEEHKAFWEMAVLNKIDEFMLFLFRHTAVVSLPYDSSQKPNALSLVHLYVRSRYHEDITLDKLANIFFLNKFYLAHAFKKKYGMPLIQFLNQTRCDAAHKMLETTNLSITEIAISVGFNSVSHFSETYKKFQGVTPAHTRKKAFNSMDNNPD